jgi:hypothetical protein
MLRLLRGDRELVLEMGLAAAGLGIVSALALLVAGRLVGDRQRNARHADGPPPVGSVPAERHQNLSASPR